MSKESKKKVGKVRKSRSKAELKPITKIYQRVSLTKVKTNMIYTGKAVNMYIKNGKAINLTESWTELIISLLGVLYENHKEDYLKQLMAHGIIRQGFDVSTKRYITLDSTDIKAYQIPKSEFYVAFKYDIFEVKDLIFKLLSTLNIKLEDICLDIIPLNADEKQMKNIGDFIIETRELDIAQAVEVVQEGSKIKSISIFGIKHRVKNYKQAVEKVLDYIKQMNTEEKINKSMVCNIQAIGLCDSKEIDCSDISELEGTKLYLYCNSIDYQCLAYIFKLCTYFNISYQIIKLEIEQKYYK